MKRTLIGGLVLALLAPVGVQSVYQPIEIIGRDTSGRNTSTQVYIGENPEEWVYGGKRVRVEVGESLSLILTSNEAVTIEERAEIGWYSRKIHPKKRIVLKFRMDPARKPELFIAFAAVFTSRRRDFPNVPIVYPERFPENFQNYLPGWGYFDRPTIEQEAGKLLMLDMDFGRTCSLNCPTCFRRHKNFEHGKSDLSFEETYQVVLQAKELGLREVKFLGAGEMFEDPMFLPLLCAIDELGIYSAVFTKGHPIADDEIVARVHSVGRIRRGLDLAKILFQRKVSIIVGFNAINAAKQDCFVHKMGHTQMRNKAIEMLAEVGFNKSNPTRLSLGSSPITIDNIGDMLEVYQWARVRNMNTVICPTMISGRCSSEQVWRKITPDEDKLVDLYTKIYWFNLNRGIQTLNQLRRDGISAYAGVHPCNQVACGLYITLDGTVFLCPGDDTKIVGDVREESLKDIWERSVNFRRAGTYNCGCPAKIGRSIPTKLFRRVMENLEAMHIMQV